MHHIIRGRPCSSTSNGKRQPFLSRGLSSAWFLISLLQNGEGYCSFFLFFYNERHWFVFALSSHLLSTVFDLALFCVSKGRLSSSLVSFFLSSSQPPSTQFFLFLPHACFSRIRYSWPFAFTFARSTVNILPFVRRPSSTRAVSRSENSRDRTCYRRLEASSSPVWSVASRRPLIDVEKRIPMARLHARDCVTLILISGNGVLALRLLNTCRTRRNIWVDVRFWWNDIFVDIGESVFEATDVWNLFTQYKYIEFIVLPCIGCR